MARKKKPEEHSHGESWLVSYCDLISLLVTFFLMMMTFSSKSTGDLEQIGASNDRGWIPGRIVFAERIGDHVFRDAIDPIGERIS